MPVSISIVPRIAEFRSNLPDIPIDEIRAFLNLDSIEPPSSRHRPYVWSNTVCSIDGVISFKDTNHDVSDIALKRVPGIGSLSLADLRLLNGGWAHADAALISGQILRDENGIGCPLMFDDIKELRKSLGRKTAHPLQLVLTSSGNILSEVDGVKRVPPLLTNEELEIVFLTTPGGKEKLMENLSRDADLAKMEWQRRVRFLVFEEMGGKIDLKQVLACIRQELDVKV